MSVPPRKAFADLLEVSLPQQPGYHAPSADKPMDLFEIDTRMLDELRAMDDLEEKKTSKRSTEWWRDRQERRVTGIIDDVANVIRCGPCSAQDIRDKLVTKGIMVVTNTCREAARALIEKGEAQYVGDRNGRPNRMEIFFPVEK